MAVGKKDELLRTYSMRLIATVMTLALVMLFAQPAAAQDDFEFVDILEVGFYGGIGIPLGGITEFSDSVGATLGASVGIDIGYFLKPNMVLGFSFIYTRMGHEDIQNLEDKGLYHRLFNPNVYLKYYFQGESSIEPYVKAHFGIEHPRFTTFARHQDGDRFREISYGGAWALGIGAGLFYFTSDWGGLFVEGNYHYAFSKDNTSQYGLDELTFGENVSVIDIHAGVRVLFGKD
jgi:hypothetical protein